MVPVGTDSRSMRELPGIPDRYTFRQPIQFRCANRIEPDRECGHIFVKTCQTHNIQARCPQCGQLQDETSAIFYHRRSGLPTVGAFAVNPRAVPQSEDGQRFEDYHIVPDLRVKTSVTFVDAESVFTISLRDDLRLIEATLAADGTARVTINGEPPTARTTVETGIRPGGRHDIEFYVADGNMRLFVDSLTPLLDVDIWKEDKRPLPRQLPKTSGVSLTVAGGEVDVSDIKLDRDVFCYSGWERGRGDSRMNAQGEVYIDENNFFPVGDHCTSSYDARYWGPVSLSRLQGPALFVWWPPERVGLIR